MPPLGFPLKFKNFFLVILEVSLKRCYYIADGQSGPYFFLADDHGEFMEKLYSYGVLLFSSGKMNHYRIGSVEMSSKEFEEESKKASEFEASCISRTKVISLPLDKPKEKKKPKLTLV